MAQGHIYRRRLKSGKWSSWYAVIDGKRGRDGKRRQVTRSFETRQLAQVWLAQQVQNRNQSGPDPILLGEYLNHWIAQQPHLSESTLVSYRGHIESYLVPHLGSLVMSDLSPDVITAVYRHLLQLGLSVSTVRRINATLSGCLSAAVQEGLLPSNPARQVRIRGKSRSANRVWTTEEAITFLRMVREDELYVLWRMALLTGLRRGELLGLQIRDVDVTSRCLTVRQNRVMVAGRVVTKSPKSKRSVRSVVFDAVTADLLNVLVADRSDSDGLLFTDKNGAGLIPGWVSRRFQGLVREAGLPVIRFHDLRHTSATLGLTQGESVKEVSARLGHSSVAITGDLYLQVPGSLARKSADGLAGLLDGQAVEDVA